jgi:hypothetical protein
MERITWLGRTLVKKMFAFAQRAALGLVPRIGQIILMQYRALLLPSIAAALPA